MPPEMMLDPRERTNKNVMLEVKELTTKYITRYQEEVYAVDHVSLKVKEGNRWELRANLAVESRPWRSA
jgi:ABC-type glutathione transport system ATPase component